MENCTLPTDTAKEPEEEAHLSQGNEASSQNMNKQRKAITFAEGTQSSENSASQNSRQIDLIHRRHLAKEYDKDFFPSSEHLAKKCQMGQFDSSATITYKDSLSQPARGLTHKQRLLWLQKRRSPGLWAQCDDCDRWRYLPHVLDAQELPGKWRCSMNPDKSAASCSVPEVPIQLHDEEDLIHGEYTAGSIVWARLSGWPWWPAMVDDCPDTEQYYWLDGFSDIPTYYNVVFFDAFDVTRAWIDPEHLLPFASNKRINKVSKDKRYKKRLEVAIKQAEDASKMPLKSRLAKYSFIARYPGSINHPKKISKIELQKFQKKLKRKYNIEFPIESGSSDDEEHDQVVGEDTTTVIKKGNSMLLVGTPRSSKQKKNSLGNGVKKNIAKKIIPEKVQTKEPQAKDSAKDVPKETESENVNNESASAKDVPKEAPSENVNNESASETFKQPSSMAVQVSNTLTAVEDESIETDTSTTYVPESQNDILQEVADSVTARVPSPSSDDFDF